MIRNLMALPCMLALVLACDQGRTDGQDTGAAAGGGAESGALPADTGFTGGGVEDTTAAPSVDAADTAAPAGDTAAPSSDTEPSDSAAVGATGEAATSDTTAEGATSDTTY